MATSTKMDQNEAAAAAGIALPPASAEEYNQVVEKARVDTAFDATADAGDAGVGWTAQSGRAFEAPEDVPGQRFAPWQLPDPNVAVRAGLPPVAIPEHLITEDEDDPQGPTAQERANAALHDQIRERALREYSENRKAQEEASAPAEEKSAATRRASSETKSS